MTEDQRAKAFFDYTNRGWPEATRTKWEQMMPLQREMWIERLRRKSRPTPVPSGEGLVPN